MGKCVSVQQPKETEKPSISTSPNIDTGEEYKSLKQIPRFPITEIARNSIYSALSKSHLFSNISSQGFDIILKHIVFCIAEKNTIIFSEGSKGTLCFIINSGQVEITSRNNKKLSLSKDGFFGEMALISDSIRKETVRSINKSSFWVLSSRAFFEALKSIFKKSYDEMRNLIKNTVFFKNLPEFQIDLISKVSLKAVFKDSEVIIREGEVYDLLYVLKKGSIEFFQGTKLCQTLTRPGEMFGEDSLLTGTSRNWTCVSKGLTEVISINLAGIKSSLGENFENLLLKNIAKNSIIEDSYFKFIDLEDIIEICLNLTWKKYRNGETVFSKKGNRLKSMYVICSGSVWVQGVKESTLNNYQAVGMRNLNEKNLVSGEYSAIEDCVIGEISVPKIEEILKISISSMSEHWETMTFLKSFNFLKVLDLESIKELSKSIKKYNVIADTVVFEIDNKASKIYFVKSGVFEIFDSTNNRLRIVKGFDVFGEKCLIEEKRTASVHCTQEGEFYAVHKSDIAKLKEFKDLVIDAKRREYYQRKIDISQTDIVFEYKRSSGRKNLLIQTRTNNLKYELVVIQKYYLENRKDCEKVVRERDIMIQIEHRQLVKMVFSYIDNFNIYFVTEYIPGSLLSTLLPLNENIAKVMVLHFVKILAYLHQKNIAYLDFCTDNIIISSAGIPFLSNFQFAKIIENRSYTRVGNPFYRSPEMILARGYTKSTDVWSLGVVFYEMIYRKLPFDISYSDSPAEAYEKILNVIHGFDETVSKTTNKLLAEMLCKSDVRIDLNAISRNECFSNVDKGAACSRLTLCPNVFEKEIMDVQFDFRKNSVGEALEVMGI